MDRRNNMRYEKELSVILPAWQEAENLKFLLPEIHKTVRKMTQNYEILIVDTIEPTDNTEEICNQYHARLIRRYPSNDYGDAVRTGIKYSQGQWIIFMDADGSHAPSVIPDLCNERDKAHIVIASRYTTGGKTINPLILILMSLAVNIIYRLVLGIPCRDISNSFRLYQRDYLKNLELKCNNFDILQEILCKVTVNPNVKIKEIPFCFQKRQKGKTKRNHLKFACSYIKTLMYLKNLKKEYIRQQHLLH